MTNQEIARLFRNVSAAYSIKNSKKYFFQIIAYQKAAEAISMATSELQDLYKEGKMQEIPGIGATIRSRLDELFRKGSVSHFNAVLKGIPEAVFVLMDVPSIGPKKAYKLSHELRLNKSEKAIEDLILMAQNHKIAKIPTFGEQSERDILKALIEYKKGMGKATRMTLPYAGEVAEKILTYLRKSSDIITVVPLGSLRRMMATVGDIDIAAATNTPEKTIKHFVSYPYKERVIEQGLSSASILTSGGVQIDLIAQPPESFGSLLQHFTGSKDHNVHLREYALKKGLSLSEKGIKKSKTSEKIKQYDGEEKFYDVLGMQWIPPEMREDKGEIELAIAHKLPDLVGIKDVKGDLHVHSSFPIEPSHDLGHTNIEKMTILAKKLNYDYIGFAEHNPSISKHSKSQIYALVAKRNDHIEQIKSKIKSVHIIKLLEIDILSSGKLAVDEKCLELLDAAIVGIHSSLSGNKKEMTKRVLAGLSHPKAKILAHPTGRMLNERAGYELDFDQIFDFCKKNNKALEINSWPQRLDLPDNLIKEAVENGVKLAVNTDSHDVSQMSLIKYGVATARRGWATKNDIINTLKHSELMEWLRK